MCTTKETIMKEELIQSTAISTIQSLYPNLLISPSLSGIQLGGSITSKAQTVAILKRSGFRKGIPDILIYLPNGTVLNLQFKRPKGGVQSIEQKEVESILTKLGHNYYIVTSSTEALTALADNLLTDYRLACYKALIADLPTILVEPILWYPIGTKLTEIQTTLKQMYNL